MTDRWAIVLPVGEKPILLHCDTGSGFELKTLQAIVEGYIETTNTVFRPLERGKALPVLIVNEEGRLQGLQHNAAASFAAMDGCDIVGNAILMAASGEELIGFLKNDAIKLLAEMEDLWTESK